MQSTRTETRAVGCGRLSQGQTMRAEGRHVPHMSPFTVELILTAVHCLLIGRPRAPSSPTAREMPRGVAVASIARLPSSTDDPSGSTADRHPCRARRAPSRTPRTSPLRANAPTLRRATTPPPARRSRRRVPWEALPPRRAARLASCVPRATTRARPARPPASAALLASFALLARRESWTRSARRARTPM